MSPRQWQCLGERSQVWPGRTWPLGADWSAEATNFAVHAPAATAMWVCLFDEADTETRHRLEEQSFGVWHGAVPDVAPGTRYGYRADGPWDPGRELRFNPAKLLLDPYARAVAGSLTVDPAIYSYDPDAPREPDAADSAPYVPRGVVVADDGFDWEDDRPSLRRWRDTVVYELHVKGMTALHDRVPDELRGTYAGLAHPAVTDYLRELGVTAVELLPVHQSVSEPFLSLAGRSNYWGYNTIGFFAPHGAYAAAGDRGGQVTEFKAMVKAFHAAGIDVILDVVYNHTAEANPLGPTLSFRGLDEPGYYTLDPSGETYWDVTGCGNTVDAGKLPALRLILDSLRYWTTEMHVDGFRFDLLPALTRVDRRVDMRCALLTAIGQDPVLRHVKLIAEPWDASYDGYSVGRCPPPWVEWNDRYRDTVRDFWRDDAAAEHHGVRDVATRLAGSSDLYADDGRSPYASVNFVTAHDGFTLRDLVSYAHKHNEANGEDNRDGTDGNRSSNGGVEGPTDDTESGRAIDAGRRRRAANLLVTLLLSNGVPMLVAGDERGRTQGGNNNAYCQDNETSWIDWRPDDAWLELHALARETLRLRREHPVLRQRHFHEGTPTVAGGAKDLAWLHPAGRELTTEDWHDGRLRVLGMLLCGTPLRSPGPRGEQESDASFLLWFNAGDAVEVSLPADDRMPAGEVVLSTDPDLVVGTRLEAGTPTPLGACSVVVIRQA